MGGVVGGGVEGLGTSLLSGLVGVWVWVFERAPVPVQAVELGGLLGAGVGSMQTGLAEGSLSTLVHWALVRSWTLVS